MFIRWLEKNWTQQRGRTGVLISLAMALLIFWGQHWGWFELAEKKSLDWRYRNVRLQDHLRKDIMILDIDEQSIRALEGVFGRFPWPRDVHATMLNYLFSCGAKAVAFDVILAEPTQNPMVVCPTDGTQFQLYNQMNNPDEQLAQMTGYTGFVHHAAQFTPESMLTKSDSAVESVQLFGIDKPVPDPGIVFDSFPQLSAPLPALAANAAGVGAINVMPDDDGPVRRSYTLFDCQGKLFPSLSISVLRQLASDPEHRAQIRVERDAICVYNPDRVDSAGRPEPVSYRIPVDEIGRMNVHYYGGMMTYDYYPYANLLANNYAALQAGGTDTLGEQQFKGKIIFVGSTATGLMDLRATPFSSTYAGVETHATMLNNMLEQDFLRDEPRWLLLVLLLALAGIMGLWVAQHRALQGGLLTLLLFAACFFAVVLAFQRLNLAMSMVAPLAFIAVNYIVLTGAGYMVEERKRRQVTSAFSQFVNPHVVQEMLKDPDKLMLGGEKRPITVFFSDLAGFTTIAETLSPEEMVKLLNEYLTEMADVIFSYDGTVDKFIGDAVMAFWNAPLPQADHARRACWAALDQLKRLDELRPLWLARGYPEMNARMGINTGDVVVGNMGSRTYKNYTVIGDTVNLGARLEPANKPFGTRIMISETTYEIAKEFIEARRLDALQVKGKTKAVFVFELMAKKGELTAERQRMLAEYNAGIDRYLAREWDAAVAAFERALAITADDGPSRLYIDRCRAYRNDPPPADWNGVWVLKTK